MSKVQDRINVGRRLKAVAFSNFNDDDLGRCRISKRAIEAVQKHTGFDAAKAELAIAQNAYQAWERNSFCGFGHTDDLWQQEIFLPSPSNPSQRLPIYVAWNGRTVAVDTVEFFPLRRTDLAKTSGTSPSARRVSFDGRILHDDCLSLIPTLVADSIAAVITSPPYAQQRSSTYGGIAEAD